jgi:hypothetical protein
MLFRAVYIGGFPHVVNDAGEDWVGRSLDERVDLARVYATIWKEAAPARLVDNAVFCDSDDHAHAQHQLLRVCAAGTPVRLDRANLLLNRNPEPTRGAMGELIRASPKVVETHGRVEICADRLSIE